MSEEPLVFYGCGTQGQAILEWLLVSQPQQALVLTDDNPALWRTQVCGHFVLPPDEALKHGSRPVLCAIGDNLARARTLLRLREQGHRWRRFLHPSAIIAPSAGIADGSVVLACAVVNSMATVGAGCLVNTHAVVEHHCEIGNYAHLAPGAVLGGCVHVEAGAFLGLGSVVIPGKRVGRFATLGAGAVLLHDAGEGDVLVGNPARLLRHVSPPELSPCSPACASP